MNLSGMHVLVTGASGYIGGELVAPLLEAGAAVRVLTRSRDALRDKPWANRVEIVEGDATRPADLEEALRGIDTAYYLLHSMDGAGDIAQRDHEMAQAFVTAAEQSGVRRIVYLGGMQPEGELSEHLASRADVGEVFLASSIPSVVLQAAVILGSGSVSFQMLRYLTRRLPAMVAPRWLDNKMQPIAIDDVLHYLVGAATLPPDTNRTFDIGGPEVVTYRQLIQRFAAARGVRRRLIVTVPVLTPSLSSHWVGVVTPVDTGVAKPLVGSLIHEVVAQETDLRGLLPRDGGLVGIDDALSESDEQSPPDNALRNVALTIGATVSAAALGSLATNPQSRWYRRLDKPAWQPPAWAFPVVWSALYADIAATTAMALNDADRARDAGEARAIRTALLANLATNAGWSAVFFRAKQPAAAAVVSAALTASSADLARRVGRRSTKRGVALAPYAAWCAFATALSAAIARRNG